MARSRPKQSARPTEPTAAVIDPTVDETLVTESADDAAVNAAPEVTAETVEETTALAVIEPEVVESEVVESTGEISEPDLSPVQSVVKALLDSVDLPEDRTWGEWPAQEIITGEMNDFRVQVPTSENAADQDKFELYSGERLLGSASIYSLRPLGHRVSFPTEFVAKLPRELGAQVINNRLETARAEEYSTVTQDGEVVGFYPGWRDFVDPKVVCDVVYASLVRMFDQVEIRRSFMGQGRMGVTMMTPKEKKVTKKVGDALRLGVQVYHDIEYGLSAQAFIERLVCLNGMTANRTEFNWGHRTEGTVDHQLMWLLQQLEGLEGVYDNIVTNAQKMAETTVEGDPIEVLREHARAMGVPMRYLGALIHAFNQEPGNTLWHITNALTNLATHSGIRRETAEAIMLSAGDWTTGFELVTARMPRPIAVRVGAHILEAKDVTLTAN